MAEPTPRVNGAAPAPLDACWSAFRIGRQGDNSEATFGSSTEHQEGGHGRQAEADRGASAEADENRPREAGRKGSEADAEGRELAAPA